MFTDILTIAILAVLSRSDDWDEVVEWAQAQLQWLATFLPLPRGIPSADTFRRVFGDGLDELMGYVSGRLEFTEYKAFQEEDYVIGSGMMESTCKQVVGQRLNGAGMQWSEPGAIAMAALVGKKVNGIWKSFWETRPLQPAA